MRSEAKSRCQVAGRKEQILKLGLTLLLLSIAIVLIGAKGCLWWRDKDDDDDIITGSSGDPAQVTTPSPANGATSVPITSTLTWVAASGATSYNVCFSTVSPPSYVTNTTGTIYDPGTLNYDMTYYWSISSVNSSGSVASAIWNFQTITGFVFYVFGGEGNILVFDEIVKFDPEIPAVTVLSNTNPAISLPSGRWLASAVWDPVSKCA